MKEKRKKKIIRFSTIFLSLIVLSFAIVFVYNLDLSTDSEYVEEDFGPECSNLSFQDTAICLNDFVREIFIYNSTNDDIDLTLEDLKRRGGDCRNYVEFYDKYMTKSGYPNNQKVRMLVEKNETLSSYHVFMVSSHSSGYCNMDMRNLECYQYINNSGETK